MKTRKELVLELLEQHKDAWVDGPDIANERVGGSEGLKRLRELRQEGFDIRMRRHPDERRDIFQYKLTTRGSVPPTPTPIDRGASPLEGMKRQVMDEMKDVTPYEKPFPLARNDDGSFGIVELVCTQCGTAYKDIKQHLNGPEHKAWRETQMPTPKLVDPPPVKETYVYKERPKTIEFGSTVPCPRCGGRTTKNSPEAAVDPTYTKDLCHRCNGLGVVPNVGPV